MWSHWSHVRSCSDRDFWSHAVAGGVDFGGSSGRYGGLCGGHSRRWRSFSGDCRWSHWSHCRSCSDREFWSHPLSARSGFGAMAGFHGSCFLFGRLWADRLGDFAGGSRLDGKQKAGADFWGQPPARFGCILERACGCCQGFGVMANLVGLASLCEGESAVR